MKRAIAAACFPLASFSAHAATATPLAPSELVAAAVSPTRIDLAWKANSEDEAAGVIERRREGAEA